MIAQTNAKELLLMNLQRTEILIAAMEKVKAFNQIYQMKQTNSDDYRIMRDMQDAELVKIEKSCGEHAIISLATAFETYYKELSQQLLAQHPEYFIARRTVYSDKVINLIHSDEVVIYEDIERELQLKDRFGYYAFFNAYSIPFLLGDDEEFIKHLYLRRNNYVHNAGRPDQKLKKKLDKNPSLARESTTSTEAKRLRTKLIKILGKSYDRVISAVKEA